MNDFIKTITHGRRLQGAVKSLSNEELTLVISKLEGIIEKRKEKQQALLELQEEKRKKAEEIKKQMLDAGLDISDLQAVDEEPAKEKVVKKRPIKYRITDANGETTNWTGIGRMPRVFRYALENGQQLSDFAI